MIGDARSPTATGGILKIFDWRANGRDLLLHNRLVRIGDREKVQVQPKLLQRRNLISDKGLRQARVASDQVADLCHGLSPP